MAQAPTTFHEAGTIKDQIRVEISLQIIGLFSEGLYSSPNKAIEELVSNAFDADATRVHVVISPDRRADDSSIVVLDNGIGMDDDGLKVHWIVGDSRKSRNRITSGGRRTIGKFGIGKLAAYVLGDRLTHITKSGDKYYSTSMDFRTIPKTADVDSLANTNSEEPSKPVTLDLRELSESEARSALGPWLNDDDGRTELTLFGPEAENSWTAAIISDLKDLATDLKMGRLRWVLSTAMPLRDDFVLYLNGEVVSSSKIKGERIGSWVLGREIATLPKPAPDDLEAERNEAFGEEDFRHWQLTDGLLGPITGYVEVFKEPIDAGKSKDKISRSNGFFVYVNGRLINAEDSGFGIDRNILRHGTFSRFRVVVNMDRLDGELRSSRESLRGGPMLDRSKAVLQALFNLARAKLEADQSSSSPGRQASQRLSDSPASLVERPLLQMVVASFEGSFKARHLVEPDGDQFQSGEQLLAHVEARIKEGAGLFTEVGYADQGTHGPMAKFDAVSGALWINLEHPFVAHFADEFDKKKNLPLQLFATSEVVFEAQLLNSGMDAELVALVLDQRDELLRHLARSSGAENSLTVAQDLLNAESNAKDLEEAVVAAFRQLGFEAVPKAGNDEPDGLAEAFLSAGAEGDMRHYRVSLEAKSKEKPGGKVKKKAVEVSTIARHRHEAECDHAIVIGPEFETGADGTGALMREIEADRERNPGQTITLMRIRDLARLVRIAPVKRLNLEEIRTLLSDCTSPDECERWVDRIERKEVEQAPYQAILEEVWTMQQEFKDHSVEYSGLRVALARSDKKLTISDAELRSECAALSRMAPNLFVARDNLVELNTRPSRVLDVVHDYIEELPSESESNG